MNKEDKEFQLTLNYIGKVHNALVAMGRMANASSLLLYVFCFLFIWYSSVQ